MNTFKRFISVLTALSLVLSGISPAIPAFAANTQLNQNYDLQPTDYELIDGTLPPFPEDLNRVEPDWSKIDWDKEVILIPDQEAYQQRLTQLEAQGKYDEMANLRPSTVKLSDSKALDYYNMPREVKEEVASYTQKLRLPRGVFRKKQLQQDLKENLKVLQVEKELKKETAQQMLDSSAISSKMESEDPFNKTLPRADVSNAQPVRDSKVRLIENKQPHEGAATVSAPNQKMKSQTDFIREELEKELGATSESPSSKASDTSESPVESKNTFSSTKPPVKKTSFSEWVQWMLRIPVAKAAWTTPLISYYTGIEKNTMDALLYNWSVLQSTNGSFGLESNYETSAAIFFLLRQFGRTSGDQYTTLVNYLTAAAPNNNRVKAVKVRVLFNLNQPYTTLLNEILANQNADGGFGIQKGYESDIVTTLEVLWAMGGGGLAQTIPAAEALNFVLLRVNSDGSMRFKPDSEPSFYLINKTLEYLKPYQNYCVAFINGAYSIEQSGHPNSVFTVQSKTANLLSFLSARYNTQTLTLQGSDQTQDLLGTLYSFQLYGAQQTIQDALWAKTKELQNLDGSFGTNMYTTIAAAKVFPEPDLIVTDIAPVGALVNRQDSTFIITVQNKGYAPASGPLTLHFFTDKYKYSSWEAVDAQTVIGSFANLTATYTFRNSYAFLADTELEVFAESAKDVDYTNNWRSETFNFAADPGGEPALQTYFIVNQYSSAGVPGFNVRWKAKATDANREFYVVQYRPQGTSTWYSYLADTTAYPNGFFTADPYFTEGSYFEFRVGVQSSNGNQLQYAYNDIITVRTTATDTNYTGTVTGSVTVDNKGTSGMNTYAYSGSDTSGTDGQLSYAGLPNGSGAAWVRNMDQYESFITTFAVPEGGTTSGIRLLTTLRPDTQNPTISSVEIRGVGNATRFNNQQEVSLFAFGSDDVALKEADFYYYSPTDSSWHFITTEQVQNGVAFSYNWYVPQSLALTTGYKIKAVVWDHKSNSTTAESAPFEILDGTVPTGTVSVAGLTGNKWKLGEAHAIQWNLNTASPLARIDQIRLRWGTSGYEYLVQNYDITQTSYSYTLPLEGRFVSLDAYIDFEFCDVNNNCATIESSRFEIEDNSPPLQPPWQALQPVDPMTASWPVSRAMKWANDLGNGNREIAYLEYDGPAKRVVYRKYWNGAWQSPINMAEYLNAGQPEYEIQYMNITGSQNGDVHLAYERKPNTGDFYADIAQQEVFYSHIASGSLVANRQISSDTTSSRLPDIAVSSAGRVSIIWKEGFSYVPRGGFSISHFVDGDGYSSWGSILELNSGDNVGYVEVAYEGADPIAIFQDYGTGTFIYRKRAGSSWGPPISIYRADIPKTRLDQFTSDATRLSSIVDAHPQNPLFYNWKTGIRTKQDLESRLNSNGFANTASILTEWDTTQYAYNSYDYTLFINGGNEYDFFFRGHSEDPRSQSKYTVKHLRFLPASPERTIRTYKEVPNRPFADEIGSTKVLRNAQGNYHIFYIKSDTSVAPPRRRPHHVFYNGTDTFFETYVVPYTVNIGDSVLAATEVNNRIAMYYSSYSGGQGNRTFASTADYSATINNTISAVTPTMQSTGNGTPANLTWSASGSAISSYDVYFGASPIVLSQVASNSTASSYTANSLVAATTYYWQVVGHSSGGDVYSNIFNFTTKNDLLPPVISNLSASPTTFNQGCGSTVEVTGTATDAGSTVASAEVSFVDTNGAVPIGGDWTLMAAVDGAFNSAIEGVISTIDACTWSRTNSPYTISIRATDSEGNISTTATTDVTVTNNAPSVPEINVQENAVTIEQNTVHTIGTTLVGTPLEKTFSIQNLGSAALNLTGTTRAYLTGTNAADFTVVEQPPASISPGQSSDITIRFSPTSQGGKTALLELQNNDADEGNYSITLSGTGQLVDFTKVTTGDHLTTVDYSSGASFADIDGDGDEDLYVANRVGSNSLYINVSGTFIAHTTSPILSDGGQSNGSAWGDMDNDGDLDVYVNNWNTGSENYLYRNDNGAFVRITTGDVATDTGQSMDAKWVDYDNDGWLDLFVVHKFNEPNVLYHNNQGTLAKTLTPAIVSDTPGGSGQWGDGRSSSWADYDGDGDMDVYISDWTWPNRLYRNDGAGVFTKITTGELVNEIKMTLGADWVDYDNDGDLDLFVVNGFNYTNDLYRNEGGDTFVKDTNAGVLVTRQQGIAAELHNSTWGDIDNDGDMDVAIVSNFDQPNALFLNNGSGVFTELSNGDFITDGGDSRSVLFSDTDGDGDLDMYVVNSNQQNFFYRNNLNSKKSLSVSLKGVHSNTSAIGSQINVQAALNGQTINQLRSVSGQGGYNVGNGFASFFGLGTNPVVSQIQVTWPAGGTKAITNHSLTNILAGWWSFDTLGTILPDLSANNNTASLTNAAFTPGIHGRALRFDGVSGSIVITDQTAIQDIFAGGGSFSAWIKPDGAGEGDNGRVAAKNNAGTGWEWGIYTVTSNSASLRFTMNTMSWTTANTLPLNEWAHVVINYNADVAINTPAIFVNGVSLPLTAGGNPAGVIATDAASHLYIGNNPWDSRTFDGDIDEVRLYNNALTQAQISNLYLHPGSQLTGSNLTIVEEVPKIAIYSGSTLFQSTPTSASEMNFGAVTVGNSAETSFTITNNGDGAFTQTESPPIIVAGTDAGEFSVVNQPSMPIAAGQSQAITLRFAPTTEGTKSALIIIRGNDANRTPMEVRVTAIADRFVPTAAPVSAFTVNQSSGIGPLTVQFSDQSANGPSSWLWQFGDGLTSTLQNPSHTYRTSGTYSVRLTSTNTLGSDQLHQLALIRVSTQQTVALPQSIDFNSTPGTEGIPVNRIEGVVAKEFLGYSVGAGDIDGDGYDDMLLSGGIAYFSGRPGSGTMSIIYGSPTLSLSTVYGINTPPSAVTHIYGEQSNDWLGDKVVSGDINGDGYSDVIVTALGADPGGRSQASIVYIIYGSPALRTLSSLDLLAPSSSITRIWGERVNDWMGYTLSTADINADGYSDILMSSHRAAASGRASAGKVYIVYGASDFDTVSNFDLLSPPRAITTILGEAEGDKLGIGLGSGDINGDGFADILMGSPHNDTLSKSDVGSVTVILGRNNISSTSFIDLSTPSSGLLKIIGDSARDKFGYKVISADMNGDGYSDIISTAEMADPSGKANAGEVVVLYGSSTLATQGTIDISTNPQGITRIQGENANDRIGYSLASGDVDGDGRDEILIGSWRATSPGGAKAGKTYLVYGAANAIGTPLLSLIDTSSRVSKILGDNQDDYTGWSLAMGDMDGDTRSESIISSFLADPNGLNKAGQVYVVYSGTVANASEIQVLQGQDSIPHSGSVSFGTQTLLLNTDVTFRVQNSGLAPLQLTGSPIIAIEGTDASSFSVVTNPLTSIAAGTSSEFTIRYTPTTEGPKTAQLRIPTNDPDEALYVIVLNGDTPLTTLSIPDIPQSLSQFSDTPSLAQIVDGYTTTDQTPQLRFRLSAPLPSSTLGFTVQIDENGIYDGGTNFNQGNIFNYSTLLQDLPNPESVQYQVPTVLANGSYFWRVRAENASGGYSEWAYGNNGLMAFQIDTLDESVWTRKRIVNMSMSTNAQTATVGALEDQSGKGNHGTLGNGDAARVPVWIDTGIQSGAYNFDGTDDTIGIPLASVSKTDYTMLFFFNTTCADCGVYTLNNGTGQNDRDIYLQSGNICSRVWDNEAICTTGQNYADGNWHYVSHVFGGRVGGQKIFVDGVERAGGAKTSSDLTAVSTILLGQSALASNTFFDGGIDELQIYNYALAADVILSKFQEWSSLIPVPIVLPPSTTAAPPQMPASQETRPSIPTPITTAAPPSTTGAPQATTATPAAPPSTTATPPSTTEAPPSTTVAPSATTAAPPSTTAASPSTTAAPPATTAAPPPITAPPPSTESPPPTTGVPEPTPASLPPNTIPPETTAPPTTAAPP